MLDTSADKNVVDMLNVNPYDELKDIEPFKYLEEEDLKLLLDSFETRYFKTTKEVTLGDRIYLLKEGRAMLIISSKYGRYKGIRYFKGPRLIGLEMLLLDDEEGDGCVEPWCLYSTLDYYMKVYPQSLLMEIPFDRFRPFLSIDKFYRSCVRILARENLELMRHLYFSSFTDITERLVLLLYSLAIDVLKSGGNDKGSEEVVIPRDLKLSDIAALVGSVREVVSRAISNLERVGVIRKSRREIVVNLRLLQTRYRYLVKELSKVLGDDDSIKK